MATSSRVRHRRPFPAINYALTWTHFRYEIVEVPDIGWFYLDDSPGPVQTALRSGKPWSPILVDVFREYVVPGTTVIDVGAHIGSMAVPLARLVGPEGRLYAFEPQRSVFRELHHNLKLNGHAHATAYMMAVSSEAGFLEMAPTWVDEGYGRIGKGGERVEARTLDSFGFTDVSLIKIDVEGHELEVLNGAMETIRRWHPTLVLEMGKKDRPTIGKMLTENGYRLKKLVWVDYVAVYDPALDKGRAD